MHVKLLKVLAGPHGGGYPGDRIELPDDYAQGLVEGGYAEADPPAEEPADEAAPAEPPAVPQDGPEPAKAAQTPTEPAKPTKGGYGGLNLKGAK